MGIQALSQVTIRSITSGPVITSISSVVKELVENALDAGATNIEVKLESGGLTSITVSDNGSGIEEKDRNAMGLRHFTSKIENFKDLECVTSYGFRGEALSSMCAVADVVITTKTQKDPVAIEYTMNIDGSIQSQKPSALGDGTTITVSNLFNGFPVRRQGLSKNLKNEVKKVEEIVVILSIIHPNVRVILKNDSKILCRKDIAKSFKAGLLCLFDRELLSQLSPILYKSNDGHFAVQGFLPSPQSDPSVTSKSQNERCFMYVNQRPINHKEFVTLIASKFVNYMVEKEKLTAGTRRYPFVFLDFTIPPNEYDVNFEPSKNVVLFHEQKLLMSHLEEMLNQIYPLTKSDPKEDSDIWEGTQGILPDSVQGGGGEQGTAESPIPISQGSQNSQSSYYSIFSKSSPSQKNESESSSPKLNEPQKMSSILSSLRPTPRVVDNSQEQPIQNTSQDTTHSDPISTNTTSVKATTTTNTNTNTNNNTRTSYDNFVPSKNQQRSSEKKYRWYDGDDEEVEARNSVNKPVNIMRTSSNLSDSTSNQNANTNPSELWSDKLDSSEITNTLDKLSEALSKKNEEISENRNQKLESLIKLKERNHEEEDQDFENGGKKNNEKIIDKMQTEKVTFEESNQDKSKLKEKEKEKEKEKPKDQSKSKQNSIKKLLTAKQPTIPKSEEIVCEDIKVNFEMEELIERKKRKSLKPSTQSPSKKLRLIGRIEEVGVHIISDSISLYIFNQFRAQECVLYQRMIENYVLPREKLDAPIFLDPMMIGGQDCWNILKQMEATAVNSAKVIANKQLTFNGFDLCYRRDLTGTISVLEITGMTTLIPGFGVQDLKELLTLLSKNSDENVIQRPTKVENWFRLESKRLAKNSAPTMVSDDVKELLGRITQSDKLLTDYECPHSQPLFHKLCKIPTVQEVTQN